MNDRSISKAERRKRRKLKKMAERIRQDKARKKKHAENLVRKGHTPSKHPGFRAPAPLSPEDKMLRTKGYVSGKVTIKQYLLLVERGYDGEQVMRWTKNRAMKEIGKILGKNPKPATAALPPVTYPKAYLEAQARQAEQEPPQNDRPASAFDEWIVATLS